GIEDQREVAARLPGEHAPAVFSLDPTLVVGGDRDVSTRREIPDDSVHVRGRPFLFRKHEDGWERACPSWPRALDVHPEIAAAEIGRPEGHLGSRFAGMNQVVIRPRATREKHQADSENGWRETTETARQSTSAVSLDRSRRDAGRSTRDATTRPGS